MNIVIRLLSAFAIPVSVFVAMSLVTKAQEVPTVMQNICASKAVENLLPTPPPKQSDSNLSYLQTQGFIQNKDGSWVCYVSDPNQERHYYTLFKVQQINEKLVASSFLQNGSLIDGQDNNSLDFFMMLIEHHTSIKQNNLPSVRKYIEAFISLVKQGKVLPSHHGYFFDKARHGFILYYPITNGKLQGTAMTINLYTSR